MEKEPEVWLEKQDSVDNMEWVEKVYEKVRVYFILGDKLERLTLKKCSPDLGADPNQLI